MNRRWNRRWDWHRVFHGHYERRTLTTYRLVKRHRHRQYCWQVYRTSDGQRLAQGICASTTAAKRAADRYGVTLL